RTSTPWPTSTRCGASCAGKPFLSRSNCELFNTNKNAPRSLTRARFLFSGSSARKFHILIPLGKVFIRILLIQELLHRIGGRDALFPLVHTAQRHAGESHVHCQQ